MHTGPTLFTEGIYDALWKCKDIDCGEYIVVSEFVFAYVPHARKNYCEAEEARLFYENLSCGLNSKIDYDIGTFYGADPLNNGWGWNREQNYIYNDFCYDLTYNIDNAI